MTHHEASLMSNSRFNPELKAKTEKVRPLKPCCFENCLIEMLKADRKLIECNRFSNHITGDRRNTAGNILGRCIFLGNEAAFATVWHAYYS